MSTQSTPSVNSVREALASCSDVAADLGVFGSDMDAGALPSAGARRRATRRGLPDPVHRASLYLNPEGVLEWQFTQPAVPSSAGRRAGRARETEPEGDLVDMFEYETLEANAVAAFLEKTDQRLNRALEKPKRLHELTAPAAPGALPGVQLLEEPPKGSKRRLLIVHGTFSKAQAILDGMGQAPNAGAFFSQMFGQYDQVLAFEHPTLSVSPILNALDLRTVLAETRGPLDIIAHSRGGLVTRWALEGFGLPSSQVRAVLVGCPLGGTSLASPPRLRSTLGLLSNFGTALKAAGGVASAYVPFLLAPMAILKVATAVIGAVAKTPVLDGTIQMIPGLSAQSRVKDNPELTRLQHMSPLKPAEYYVVTSNFESPHPGWKFWRWFRGKNLADVAADKVFPEDNDLVVDTGSMGEIPAGIAQRKDFGTNATVYHTNYFEQEATLNFILKVLK